MVIFCLSIGSPRVFDSYQSWGMRRSRRLIWLREVYHTAVTAAIVRPSSGQRQVGWQECEELEIELAQIFFG